MSRFRLVVLVVVLLGSLCPRLSPAAIPANEQWRLNLINQCVGFACPNSTTGIKAPDYLNTYTICTVTTLADNVASPPAGSLRSCLLNTNVWIVFSVSGTIAALDTMLVKTHTTIDGRGADITLSTGAGFPFDTSGGSEATILLAGGFLYNNGSVDTIIFENLKIMNIAGLGGIGLGAGARYIWVDHCTFQNTTDEDLYLSTLIPASTLPPARDVTLSWSSFPVHTGAPWLGHGFFAEQAGWQDTPTPTLTTQITTHHNSWKAQVRTPLMRGIRHHAYNDLWQSTVGVTYWGGSFKYHTQSYIENAIFEAPVNIGALIEGLVAPGCICDSTCECIAGDWLKVVNPYVVAFGSYQEVNPSSTLFTPSSFYSYTPDAADAALRTAIVAGAGWQNVTPPSAGDSTAWWPFEESIGTTAADQTGNGHDATFSGSPGPLWLPALSCRDGACLHFNGTSAFLTVSAVTGLGITGDMTINFWARATSASDGRTVLAKGGTTFVPYTMDIANTGTPHWRYYHTGSGGGTILEFTAYTVPLNVWKHVVMTRVMSTRTVTLYIDGVAQQSLTYGSLDLPTDESAPVYIGSMDGSAGFFAGRLDDLYLLHTALTSTEVLDQFNAYSAAPSNAAPVVTITAPTSAATGTTGVTPLTTLAGTGTDDVGVTGVTWSCPTCTPTSGTATCASCGLVASSVVWSVASIGLAVGDNVITVSGDDGDGHTSTDSLTLTFVNTAPAPVVLRLRK